MRLWGGRFEQDPDELAHQFTASLPVDQRLAEYDIAGSIAHVRMHPAAPGFDLEAITDSAPRRIADYRMLLHPELKAHAAERGIHLIGYRSLRDLIRGVR